LLQLPHRFVIVVRRTEHRFTALPTLDSSNDTFSEDAHPAPVESVLSMLHRPFLPFHELPNLGQAPSLPFGDYNP
jgi:hypothetical protein